MSLDHAGRARASIPTVNHTIRMLDLRPASAGLPHCAGWGVLEQDAAPAQALADRIRLAKVLAFAGLVPCGDGGLDVGLAEREPGRPASALGGEERRRRLPEDAPRGGDARELGADRARGGAIARVQRAIQVAEAVEDEAEGLRGIQVVVHRLGERGEERRELACERAREVDRRRGAERLVGARERLVEPFKVTRGLLEPAGTEVE